MIATARNVLWFPPSNEESSNFTHFLQAAWLWGSTDEKWLMRVAFCALSPFCAAIWYILLSRPLLGRRPRTSVAFLAIVLGYAGIIFLLKFRMVGF